jgi:hypothetical protein
MVRVGQGWATAAVVAANNAAREARVRMIAMFMPNRNSSSGSGLRPSPSPFAGRVQRMDV